MGGAANLILTSSVSNEIHPKMDEACLTKIELNSKLLNVEFSKLAKNRCGQNLEFSILKNVYYSS
jgi:hypothetical protein